MTYREFIDLFPDEENVAKYLIKKRFEGKIVCPFCRKRRRFIMLIIIAATPIATTVRWNSLFLREQFLRKQECL